MFHEKDIRVLEKLRFVIENNIAKRYLDSHRPQGVYDDFKIIKDENGVYGVSLFEEKGTRVFKLKRLKDVYLFFRPVKSLSLNIKKHVMEELADEGMDYIVTKEGDVLSFEKRSLLNTQIVSRMSDTLSEYLMKRGYPNIHIKSLNPNNNKMSLFGKTKFQTQPVIFKSMGYIIGNQHVNVVEEMFEDEFDTIKISFDLKLVCEPFQFFELERIDNTFIKLCKVSFLVKRNVMVVVDRIE